MITKELLENAVHELRNVALLVRYGKGEASTNANRIHAVADDIASELARIQRDNKRESACDRRDWDAADAAEGEETPLCRECHRPCPIIGKAPPEGPICGPCREDER